MRVPSPERLSLRVFLMSWWPRRAAAEELARQYQAVKEEYPLVLADLARFCNAGDSSLEADAQGRIDEARTMASEGRRTVWLHIRQMLRLEDEDVEQLLEETEE